MERIVKPIITNYYGSVEVYTNGTEYYLTLEDYDGYYGVEISEELAMSLKEYFETANRKIEKIDL